MEGKLLCNNEKISVEFSNTSSSKISRKEGTDDSFFQTSNESKWSKYLSERSPAAAPDVSFIHVEKSLSTGIQPGQILEVFCERKLPTWYVNAVGLYKASCNLNKLGATSGLPSLQHWDSPENFGKCFENNSSSLKSLVTYWTARVVSACGPLLSIEHVLPHPHVSEHSWILIESDSVAGVGHGDERGYVPAPPLDLSTVLDCNSEKDLQSESASGNSTHESYKMVCKLMSFLHTSSSKHSWVDKSALQKETLPCCKRLQSGGYVEVLACASGKFGWPAKIVKNVGGRLQLKFAKFDTTLGQTLDSKNESTTEENKQRMECFSTGEHMFWLFCTDHRLRNFGWIDQRSLDGYRYVCPLSGRCLEKLPSKFSSKIKDQNLLLVPLCLPLSYDYDKSEQIYNNGKEMCQTSLGKTDIFLKHTLDKASNLVGNNCSGSIIGTRKETIQIDEKNKFHSENNLLGTAEADKTISSVHQSETNCNTPQNSKDTGSNQLEKSIKCENTLSMKKTTYSSSSCSVGGPVVDNNSDKVAMDLHIESGAPLNTGSERVVPTMASSEEDCELKLVEKTQVSSALNLFHKVDSNEQLLEKTFSCKQSVRAAGGKIFENSRNCGIENLEDNNLKNLNIINCESGKSENHKVISSASTSPMPNQPEMHELKALDDDLKEKCSKINSIKPLQNETNVNQSSLSEISIKNDFADGKNQPEQNITTISDLNKEMCLVEKEFNNLPEVKAKKRLLEVTDVPLSASEGCKMEETKIEFHTDNKSHALNKFEEEFSSSEKEIVYNKLLDQSDVQECKIFSDESRSEPNLMSESNTPDVPTVNEEMSSSNCTLSNVKANSMGEIDSITCDKDPVDSQTDFIDELKSNAEIYKESISSTLHTEKKFDDIENSENSKNVGYCAIGIQGKEECKSHRALNLNSKSASSSVLLLNSITAGKKMNLENVLNTPTSVHSHTLSQSHYESDEGKASLKICDKLHIEEKVKMTENFGLHSGQNSELELKPTIEIKVERSEPGVENTKNYSESKCAIETDYRVKNLSANNGSKSTEETTVSLLSATSCDKSEFPDKLENTMSEDSVSHPDNSVNGISDGNQTQASLKAGMVLEVVNPNKLSCIHAAIVSNVSQDGLIEVIYSSCEESLKPEVPCKACKLPNEKQENDIKRENHDSSKEESLELGFSSSVSRSQVVHDDLFKTIGNQISSFNSQVLHSQKFSAYFSDLVLLPTGFCEKHKIILHPILLEDTVITSNTVLSNSDSKVTTPNSSTSVRSELQKSSPSAISADGKESLIGFSTELDKEMFSKSCKIENVGESLPEFIQERQSLSGLREAGESQKLGISTTVTPMEHKDSENDLEQSSDTSTSVHQIQEFRGVNKHENCKSSCVPLGSNEKKSNSDSKTFETSAYDVAEFIDIDVEIVDDTLQSSHSPAKEVVSDVSSSHFSPATLKDESSEATVIEEAAVNECICYSSRKNFNWSVFLQKNPSYMPIPLCVFPSFPSAAEAGFSAGQSLEVVHPEDPETICAATVTTTTGHLLWLKIDSLPSPFFNAVESEASDVVSGKHGATNSSKVPAVDSPKFKTLNIQHIFCDCPKQRCIIIKPSSSDEIFPLGWAHNNNAKFLFPQPTSSDESPVIQTRKFCNSSASVHDVTKYCSTSKIAPTEKPSEGDSALESRMLASKENRSDPSETSVRSRWCPAIYLNHSCCPGPHLSRSKLASQVGVAVEGSVSSVVRQIVSQTLAAGFCQARLCKDLTSALHDESKDRPHWELIDVKAKSKRFSIRGSIMCPQFRDEVPIFLQRFFEVLQCCPNLWAFTKQSECSYRCKKAVNNPVPSNTGRVKRSRLDSLLASTSLLANTNLDLEEDIEDEDDEWDTKEANAPTETGEKAPTETAASNGSEPTKGTKKLRTETTNVTVSASDGADAADQPTFKKRKLNRSYAIPPARVTSDPLSWSVDDVFDYVSNEATICHHAIWLRNEKIDGKALMLLNLSTLVNQLQLPHVAVLPLAHHLCRLKMAHLLLRDGES